MILMDYETIKCIDGTTDGFMCRSFVADMALNYFNKVMILNKNPVQSGLFIETT